jgi:hypothetical protein
MIRPVVQVRWQRIGTVEVLDTREECRTTHRCALRSDRPKVPRHGGQMRAKFSSGLHVGIRLDRAVDELRTGVSRIPGVRYSGKTLNSRRVREARIARPGHLADRCPAGLIKRPFRELADCRFRAQESPFSVPSGRIKCQRLVSSRADPALSALGLSDWATESTCLSAPFSAVYSSLGGGD